MLLHPQTLFLMSIAICVGLAGLLAYVGYRRHPEMMLWSCALLCNAATYALYAGRGHISDWASVVLANMMLAASYALFGEGACRFRRRRAPRLLLWMPVGVVALSFAFLLDDFSTRVLLGAGIGMAQLLGVLIVLRRSPSQTEGRGAQLLEAGIATAVTVYLIRAITVLTSPGQIASINAEGWVPALSFGLAILSLLLLAIGVVVMLAERSQEQIREQQRISTLTNRILEMISQARPLPDVLLALTQGLEVVHPELQCSVLLLDASGSRLRQGASPSLPAEYNAAVDGLQIGPGVGSCGTAAYRGQRVIVEDISTHPDWAAFRELAQRAELRSCWSQPVLSSGGKVLGTFAIYRHETGSPKPQEVELIEQMAHLASLAIERSRWAEELSRSEKQYRRLFESAHEGICIVRDGRITVANPMLLQLLGCTAGELIGQPVMELVHQDDRPVVLDNTRRRLAGEPVDARYTVRLLTRHAGSRWFEISGVLLDLDGSAAVLMFVDDVTERRLMDERIRELAFHDSLTRVPNRRLMLDRLAQALGSNRRTGHRSALLFMDLDNFKPLNDRHGHHVGDLLLIEVADRLRRCVREVDTVARFGGDEFAVLLTELDPDPALARATASRLADRIAAKLAEPYALCAEVDGTPQLIEHRCTASIGVHMLSQEEGPVSLLVDRADAAMYEAKKAGRHAVRFSDTVA